VSEDQIAYAILFGWCGFQWGQWWAERRAKPLADPALTMLTEMLSSIIDKRKIVGRALTISSTHRFEAMGEKLSIVVQAEGDPQAFIEGEVVSK
jgi:hypothetical protein